MRYEDLSMALPGDELRRRVLAAGALHGLGMRQIRDQLELFGTKRNTAEAMISGKVEQRPKQIRDLAEALGMPEAWFTAEDWRTLIRDAPETGSDLAEGARARATEVLSKYPKRSPGAQDANPQTEEGS